MTQLLNIFSLASFQPSSDASWAAMVWASSILSLFVGPLYFCASLFYFRDASKEQLVEKTIRGTPLDRRPGVASASLGRKTQQYLLSYSLFLLCFSIPIGLTYFLIFNVTWLMVEQQYDIYTVNDFAYGLGVAELLKLALLLVLASIISVSSNIFFLIVGCLTDLECHQTWSGYRAHRLAKLYIFRFLNVFAMFAFTYFAELPWYTCMASRIATQAVIYFVSDFFVTTVLNLVMPFIHESFCRVWLRFTAASARCCYGCREDKEDLRLQIELTDEIIKVVFRQYVMYATITVLPFMSIFTLVCNVLELPVNKFRLTRLTKPPEGMVGGRRVLFYSLMAASLVSLVTFPSGALWFTPGLTSSGSGPWLCWPCVEYTRVDPPDGSACGRRFEPALCTPPPGTLDASDHQTSEGGGDGTVAAVGVSDIRAHLSRLLQGGGGGGSSSSSAEEAAARAASLSFFESRAWLTGHKRCACRPCVQMLTCGCNEPLNKRVCDALPRFSCAAAPGEPLPAPAPGSQGAAAASPRACSKLAAFSSDCGGQGSCR